MIQSVAKIVSVNERTIHKVIKLLDEGNTDPFIARYRKEETGGLDEVAIKSIQDEWQYAVQLLERKEEVIRLIDEQGKLTDELSIEINKADKLQRVEDLYRPYRQKRRTRATIAKEKGLEPLATLVWEQQLESVEQEAKAYFSEEHALENVEEVLGGVNDIIAEWISDDAQYRDYIREQTWKLGVLLVEAKNEEKDEKSIYKMYYEFSEPLHKLAAHRTLAVNRGEKEDILRVSIEAPVERIHDYLTKQLLKKESTESCQSVIVAALTDSYKRLIEPSVEREMRNRLTEAAEEQAIHIFSENLRNLLLQPPL